MPNWLKNPLLILITLAYVILGVAYAVETPPWQAPDEPAHYNYARTLAETGRLPVLRMGDYDQRYLEAIKARRFPPDVPVDPIRYESHQPPLYYILAAIIYAATGGSLVALRLLGVALGAALLWLTHRIVSDIFPGDAALALATTAFVAAVPMHVAMTAAVNNDTLAELVVALVFLQCIPYLKARHWLPDHRLRLLGCTLGAALLTKTTVYFTLPLTFFLVAVYNRQMVAHFRREARSSSNPLLVADAKYFTSVFVTIREWWLIFVPALFIGLPWFVRNAWVYGWPDFFGWRRHAAVVVGQPRTAEWVARFGAVRVVKELAVTTFRSFWAQFGWMGVLVDERIYLGLLVSCGVAGLGFVLWLRRVAGDRHALTGHQWASLGLLALSALLTGGTYLWYNLTFVQHQGRYLFPALVPIGLAFALGLREALRRDRARWLAALCATGLTLLAGAGLLSGDFHKWSMALLAAAGAALGLKSILPDRFDPWAYALPYLGLLALDAVCLWGFIVPYFR